MKYIVRVWETEEERKSGNGNRVEYPEDCNIPDDIILWINSLFKKNNYACIELEDPSQEYGVLYTITKEREDYYYPYDSDLPIFRLGSKLYFVDRKLKQLRNVYNPHDFADVNYILDNAITFGLNPEDEVSRRVVTYLEGLAML